MKLERPNYFSDANEQEILLYGEEGQYRHINLDFWKDIYPNILQIYFATNQADNDFKDYFVRKLHYPMRIEHALEMCVGHFTNKFPACFETNFNEYEKEYASKPDNFDMLKDKKGLLGALARIDNKVGKMGRYYYWVLLEIVSHFEKNIVKLTDKLPEPLYEPFLKEMRACFYKLADLAKSEEIKTEINKIVFFPHPNSLKEIKTPKKYRIEPAEFARSVIVFENIEFGKKEEELFWNVMSFPGAFYTMETVFFVNCKFSYNYHHCPYEKISSRVLFRNCLFDKDFAPCSRLEQTWKIINCVVKGYFDFRNTFFGRGFMVTGCVFDRESKISFDYSEVAHKKNPDLKNKFYFKDTIFGGTFSMRQAELSGATMLFQNVTFFQPFYFDETHIGSENTFERIAFALGNSPQMNKCKQIFTDLLLLNGYEIEAKSLGLTETEDKSKRRMLRSYARWVSSQDAETFLHRCKSWMAKKRRADKKTRTEKSIPFVGSGKGLLYPRSALDAYREQDWNKLKELCDKYGIGTQSTDVAKKEEDEYMRSEDYIIRRRRRPHNM